MQVKVSFYGVLADVTGTNCKHFMDVKSVGDLQLRIQDEFPEVVHYKYRISLNNVLINDDPLLNNGDEVALMPPFAGG
jgi:molybdopterin converting factor small subunit